MSITACSDQSFAFGTGGRTHPSPYGGRHEVRTRGLPFVRTPARRRRDCRGLYERGSGPPLFFCFIPVCSDSISCALRAVERGLLWGRCPPSRPLSNPPNHPPYLALRLCVHCPPVPTKASLSEQAGAHIHPRMRGGMKSGQGSSPFVCTPARRRRDCRGRARPENPQTFGRAVRREGWKHDVGLGRAPRLPRPEGAE